MSRLAAFWGRRLRGLPGVVIRHPGRIALGDGVQIGRDLRVEPLRRKFVIGDRVWLAAGAVVGGNSALEIAVTSADEA